jgi:hypothetical protein
MEEAPMGEWAGIMVTFALLSEWAIESSRLPGIVGIANT